MVVKMLLLLLLGGVAHRGFSAFMRHKYVTIIESVLECPNNEQMETPVRNLKYVRFNRTHRSLSCDITWHRPVDDKVGSAMLLDRWGDGGWINIPFLPFHPNACQYFMKYFKQIWISTQANLGVKYPDRCPIPPGNYSMKNFFLDTSSFNIPFWSGKFRFTSLLQTVDTRKNLSCLMLIVNAIEQF